MLDNGHARHAAWVFVPFPCDISCPCEFIDVHFDNYNIFSDRYLKELKLKEMSYSLLQLVKRDTNNFWGGERFTNKAK